MGNLSCGNLDPPPSSGGQSAASSPSALHEDGLTKRFRRCRSPFREPPKSDRHPVGMVIAIISESRSASVRNRDRHHLGTLIAIARNTQNGRPTVAHYFPAGARRRCLPLSSGHTGWVRPPVWRRVSAWRAVIQERRRAGTSPGAVASRVCLDDSTQLLLPSGCPGGGYPRQSRPPMGPSMGQPWLAGPVVL